MPLECMCGLLLMPRAPTNASDLDTPAVFGREGCEIVVIQQRSPVLVVRVLRSYDVHGPLGLAPSSDQVILAEKASVHRVAFPICPGASDICSPHPLWCRHVQQNRCADDVGEPSSPLSSFLIYVQDSHLLHPPTKFVALGELATIPHISITHPRIHVARFPAPRCCTTN